MVVSIQRDIQPATVRVSSGINAGGAGTIQLSAPPPAFQQRASGPPVRSSPSPIEEEEARKMEDAMNDFVNPSKIRPEGSDVESSFADEDDFDEDGEFDEEDEDGGDDDRSMMAADPVYAPPMAERPSPGFLSIEDEKADILFRLELLRKQGFEGGRKFTVKHDIREMRAELTRIKTHLELDRSLKFSRKALVGVVAALEFLNDKVDVLDLELDGWSEQMHRSVYSQKEYDDIFEELFFKYRGKVKAPPEVRLLMAVGGSALSFHITNSMIKKATVPALAPPEPPARAAVTTPPAMRQQAQAPGAPRREMRPPSFANPFAPPNLPPFGIPVGMAPMQTRESDARPAPPQQQQPVQIPIDDDDRLSDVPSELESLPSKMSSLSMDDEVKTVEMTTKKGKKTEKRVIAI